MMRGRRVLSVVLVAALLATGAMRGLVQQRRDAIIVRPRGQSRLSAMNSFTLGLLLGGLRGPLVMMLWTSSENQKIDKDIEDIDTKIELIRLLQPEFDSVHIFQIWNKAYNLSIMLANKVNRYIAVLDALDYAFSVESERPDNVNIVECLASLYFNKLGNPTGTMTERRYYSDRMRLETLPRQAAGKLKKGDAGWRRLHHDVLLDEHGFILPALLAPRANAVGHPDKYTGAELEFLAPFSTPEAGGFPYGVSPLALAYNYYKRCQMLQSLTGQQHVYMSDSMINSRPAVTLFYWGQDEWYLGRRLEAQMLKTPVPDERLEMEMATAPLRVEDLKPAAEPTRQALTEAIFDYRRAVTVAKDAIAEYDRFIRETGSAERAGIYASHIDSSRCMQYMMQADADYLAALAAQAGFTPPMGGKDESARLLKSAADSYRKTLELCYRIVLNYYVDERVAELTYPKSPQTSKPAGLDPRRIILTTDPKQYPAIYKAVQVVLAADPDMKKYDHYSGDVEDLQMYIKRASARLAMLGEAR
jgi:hypothetical protein